MFRWGIFLWGGVGGGGLLLYKLYRLVHTGEKVATPPV